jgi:hypothetical protein
MRWQRKGGKEYEGRNRLKRLDRATGLETPMGFT